MKLEFNCEELISATRHAVVVADIVVDLACSLPVKCGDGEIVKRNLIFE